MASGMHYAVLTDAPALTLRYSNGSIIAFFPCQRVTYPSFPGRARYQLQLCVFMYRPGDAVFKVLISDQHVCL